MTRPALTIAQIVQSAEYRAWMASRQPSPTPRAERLIAILERINSHLPPDDEGLTVEIQRDRLDEVGQDV